MAAKRRAVYSAESLPAEQEQYVRLLATNRAALEARIATVNPAPYDNVIYDVSDLPAASGGYHTLTSGTWALANAINIGSNTIRVPAGVSVSFGGYVIVGTGTVLEVAGTLLSVTLVVNSAAGTGVMVNGANAVLVMVNAGIIGAAQAVSVSLAARVRLIGGYMISSGGHGLNIGGNLHELQLAEMEGRNLAGSFVNYSSGTVDAGTIVGCMVDNAAAGITWPAASAPTSGLLITGNHFDMAAANAFSGFTPASARVNCKANTYATGLLSETAIVP